MPLPSFTSATCRRRPGRLGSGLAMLALLLGGPSLLARTPDPHVRIPLEPLGLQHLSPALVTAGSSLLTLHYVDGQHLLATFAVRRLMKRLPDDAVDDFDRTVDAVLVELPTGKVLARTSWRLHDTGRYLWKLGEGRFLLRIHDRLTTFTPMANLGKADPFQETPLLETKRRVAAVLISTDARLLTLETTSHVPQTSGGSAAVPPVVAPPVHRQGVLIPRTGPPPGAGDDDEGASQEARVPYQVNFFRLSYPAQPEAPVQAQYAGVVGAMHAVVIPADGSGFVTMVDEAQGHWAFNFNTYAGKTTELSPFDSNCQPFPEMVSRSEFVAFGCRNGQDPQVFAGFNLRGEEMWEQVLQGSYISPVLAFSPGADRFALSRVMTTGMLPAVGEPVEGQLGEQNVTVYQTDSGRQIFSISCTPVSRSGENFALSPDGMELAVVREGTVEVYRLPELSAKDRAGLKKAESLVPPMTTDQVRIYLPLSGTSERMAAAAAAKVDGAPKPETAGEAPTKTAPITTEAPVRAEDRPPVADPAVGSGSAGGGASGTATSAAADNAPSGDPEPGRRKPPTLYNEPGEQPPDGRAEPSR